MDWVILFKIEIYFYWSSFIYTLLVLIKYINLKTKYFVDFF